MLLPAEWMVILRKRGFEQYLAWLQCAGALLRMGDEVTCDFG